MGTYGKLEGTVGKSEIKPHRATSGRGRNVSRVCWEGSAWKDPGEVCSQPCNCDSPIYKAGAL